MFICLSSRLSVCLSVCLLAQIGFDLIGRPVFYSSFIQASVSRNTGDDSVQHFVYLIENGISTIRHREQHGKSPISPRVESWVWVMDCTGMPCWIVLSSCLVAQICMCAHGCVRLRVCVCTVSLPGVPCLVLYWPGMYSSI